MTLAAVEPEQAAAIADLESGWLIGRIQPMPPELPAGWQLVNLCDVARLESGHTPSRTVASYWNGGIPWISLHDTAVIDQLEIHETELTVSELGLANSSARLLPAGTVVFSRTATVGKATVMAAPMATSQDFAAYICGEQLHNFYLAYLFRFMQPEWRRLMAGSTHNTIYMPVFKALQIMLPPIGEQRAIAAALADADGLIESLERLIAKKRQIKLGAMQELLTGKRRLPGFEGEWVPTRIGDLGYTFGGLSGKRAADFGTGQARYIPFLNVITNVSIRADHLEAVAVGPTEHQNAVHRGDLFFNGSSETPEDVGLCAVLEYDLDRTYLNSFCFGFRCHAASKMNARFLAYFFRSGTGRELLRSLAQGATRYNLSKVAFLNLIAPLPLVSEQTAIAAALTDMDAEITALESRLTKARQIKQGMMQQLLTGMIRLPKKDAVPDEVPA